jgi:hypothetical protein
VPIPSRPSALERGLLTDVSTAASKNPFAADVLNSVNTIPGVEDALSGTGDLPLVGNALGKRGLLGDVLGTVGDIPVVGDVVDTTVGLLDPLIGVPLGLGLNLEVDTWLKCGLVSGLFGGRHYDLGCTCAGASGGLLLEVDVEAVVNVAGLDTWVKAEVS